jgi:hypothetical protein
VDDAWTGEASTQANDSKVAPTMLGNHVSGEDCATVVLWGVAVISGPGPGPVSPTLEQPGQNILLKVDL